jgi:nitrogen regulatory protein P-II 1
MKKLEATINPNRLDEVKERLFDLGVKTINASDVKGYARMWAHTEIYRGTRYTVNSILGIKLEVLLDDEQMEDAVLILAKGIEPGTMDEGGIIIVPVEPVPEYLACSRVF